MLAKSYQHEAEERDRVVVVHGLGANKSTTWLLSRRLHRAGFETRLFGYPSIWQTVEAHANRLARFLQRLDEQDSSRPLHLVVHSMGGIITRVMLQNYHPPSLARVVMLGTPNQGSHAARRLAPALGWICHPLVQLSDSPHSPIHQVNIPRNVEVGVIAGSRDRVVALEATHLHGQADHHVARSGHGQLLFRKDVARQVTHFLRNGEFAAGETAKPRPVGGSLPALAKSA